MFRRLAASLPAVVFLVVVTAAFGAAPVNAAAADPQASELVRLINGERAYRGLAALRVDPFLAGKARDGTIACPGSSKSVAGRAKDMATTGNLTHALSACPSYTVLDVMPSWGYSTTRGEVYAWNSGYGAGSHPYSYGCTNNQTSGCPGATTSTYYTTARAAANLMYSAQHRNIVLGSFDRVGCGAWTTSTGGYYYDCIFSLGGPNGTVSPPTTPPFPDPQPTPPPVRPPTAPPAPPVPVAPVTAPPTPAPTPAPTPSATPAATPSPTADPTATPAPTQSPSTDAVAAATAAVPPAQARLAIFGAPGGAGEPSGWLLPALAGIALLGGVGVLAAAAKRRSED